MQKKQVAIIDIGSSKITALVGEKGVNQTFLIKGSRVFEYDGYQDKTFLNEAQVKNILEVAIEELKKIVRDLSVVYVGVPGEFTDVLVKDSQISFEKKKRITDSDVDSLYDSAFILQSEKYVQINRSAVVYELDDFRRLTDPVGSFSEILKGKLSFILCDTYFMDKVVSVIRKCGVNVECISTTLAEALYLIDGETRDRIAVLLDIGYISSTLAIIQGDGILYQKSFSYGGGYITAAITERLDINFKTAEKLKAAVNLCSVTDDGKYSIIEGDNGEYYRTEDVKETVLASLDELCECIDGAFEDSKYSLPEYVSLMVTGGGISFLRGAKEHVSSRINMSVDVVAPKVPMMDKPTNSSTLSLLNMLLK